MERTRIILIGAGSAKFTQGLVADLIRSGQPWTLGLVDIDPRALEVAEGLSRRMVAAREADIVVEASTDRRDLLPGADVVVTTIGVGGRRAWEADVFIPRKYGIYQPVGDTVMPGGISRAMRMIPAMVDIARDVVALCPEATFINYANPMTVNCTAMRRATGANVIGLCIGVKAIERGLAQAIGAPPNEVTSLAAGLNHFTWIYDLRWRGQDAFPLLRAKMAEGVEEGELANRFCRELFGTYGAYPAVGDSHTMEFFPARFRDGVCCGRPLGREGHFERIISTDDAHFDDMRRLALGEAPLTDEAFGSGSGEHSELVEILDALKGDTRRTYTANLPNRGTVPNLPPDAVLEMTVVVTARGLAPLPVPDFPQRLAAPIMHRLAAQELTVEAALTGDRRMLVEALLADGAVSDPATAGNLADELLQTHRRYLPQFA
jgi:alpha-galactosidase